MASAIDARSGITRDAPDSGARPAAASVVTRGAGARTEVGWQGVAVVVALALINALRRSSMSLFAHEEGLVKELITTFGTGLLVGFSILLAVRVALRRAPDHGGRQYVAVAFAVLVSTGASVLLKDWFETNGTFEFDAAAPVGILVTFGADWLRYAVIGGLIAGAHLYLRAEAQTAAAARQCAFESSQMARQAAEARLQVLEAQIEPHFLFNTLATVKRLAQTDSAAGARMLDDLIRYLSIALPQLRAPETTLGREADLAQAYLAIQRVRMGPRFDYAIDVPPKLREARLPPLMLITLVENAIKHGIAPLPEGGAVRVSACTEGDALLVQVADTGRGFMATSGTGTGLANTRARLTALFDGRAGLAISRNEPHGVVVALRLPLDIVTGSRLA